MKILLCCSAGVTSNMFAAKLSDEAKKKGVDVLVWASADTALEYSIERADVVIITPQLKSDLAKIEDLAPAGTPVLMISDEDFTSFNAKAILEQALAAVNA